MSWDGKFEGVKEANAFFRHMRVPEQCSGEMLVAELQRVFCFHDLDDAFIQNTGSALLKELRKATDKDSVWLSNYFEQIARYPVSAKQASKHDIPYVIPLIPSIAMFSSPRRVTKRNAGDDSSADRSWKPGLFIKECLSYCVREEEMQGLFSEIQSALKVHNEGGDLFAKFLDVKVTDALERLVNVKVEEKSLGDSIPECKACIMPQGVRDGIVYAPFKRFAEDIKAVVAVKDCVSRRQFMAMLEAVVRLGTSAHVLWTCSVYQKLEKIITSLISGARSEIGEADIQSILDIPESGIFNYGVNFQLRLKEFFKDYELSSQRLNFLLYRIKNSNGYNPANLDWSTPSRLIKSVASISEYVKSHPEFYEEYEKEFSEYYRESIKRFSLSVDSQSTHLLRFVMTTLSQNMQPKEVRFARYDQSYMVRHRTHSLRSASIINAGAVTLMTLVHCCSYKNSTVLLSNLLDAMLTYGIAVPKGETMQKFKRQLRELGLTIDSPDAESGMVLQDIVAAYEGED